jgi:O-methyltransferase / aklanonic acid methyltransferase
VNNNDNQKEQIAGLYHRVAAAYGHVGPNIFAYAGQHLVEHIGLAEGAYVLDVGTGRGANLFPAAEAVGMVQETSAEIKRRNLPHVSVRQMDAEHLTFPDASFDAVLCGFAIFLFPDLEQALSEFFRVLCPGGKVGITIAQDLDTLSHWYGERISDYHARYHFPLHAGGGEGSNYAELPHYLTHAGFSDVQLHQEQADFVYADAQEWWDSRWTHGTRYSLEQMAPEVLTQFKDEVFARLAQEAQSHGIHETLRLQYILAGKEV